MTKVRVVGAIASANGITFYLEDGEELNLVKDTARTKMILDATVEALARKETIEIDLDNFSIEKRIEKQTKGLVRFFKTTVSKLVGKEASPSYDTEVIGQMDRPVTLSEAPAPAIDRDTLRDDNGRLMGDDDEITVAVVKTANGDVMIPNADRLEKQMEFAAFENSVGFEAFMKRIANVDKARGHSVQELLNFMKKGDLPIAEDGSIVAYKMLYDEGGEVFTDPHTRNVRQRVGSHVSMPIDLVDSSRRTQCSTGLHIARRAYVGKFHGDTLTLVKIAPEDVIAVPYNEPDKMRVAGYHIVGKLPKEGADKVRLNLPMTTDSASSKLLADVIAGVHPKITEYVRINGKGGTNIVVTKAEGSPVSTAALVSTGKMVQALDAEGGNGTVSIKDLRERADKVVNEQKAAQKAAESGSLAAAVSTPATPAPASVKKPVPKKAAAKTVAPVAKKSEPKKAEKSAKQLPEKHTLALVLHAEGKSNRQIEAELHICRKTLKKLFDANGLKPNG